MLDNDRWYQRGVTDRFVIYFYLLTLTSRYLSVVSTWFEIMSSPFMTFTFKTFPKHRATQFWDFLPERLKSWSVSILKRYQKIWFFLTFSNKLFLFCLKLNFMWEMLSFELLHIEIIQKIQILKISLIFSNFSVDLVFANFLRSYQRNEF